MKAELQYKDGTRREYTWPNGDRHPEQPIYMIPGGPLMLCNKTHPTEPVTVFRWKGKMNPGPVFIFEEDA